MALPAAAALARDLRAERQAMLADLLHDEPSDRIAEDRRACLSGASARSLGPARAAGAASLPDTADNCVTVLIRSARDGITTPLEPSSGATAASAFDNGFMQGYTRYEPLPPGLPTMETLKPVAERCLALAETNMKLCAAVGSAYGRRASIGETVVVR